MFHVSWKGFRTRYGAILSSLKRHRELISDEKLTIAISKVGDSRESVEGKFEALSNQMKKLQLKEKELVTRELCEQRRQRLQFVLDKLGAAGRQRQHDLGESYRHHSGGWIFDHRLFKEWSDLKIVQNSTLYLNGIPGAGSLLFKLWSNSLTLSPRKNRSYLQSRGASEATQIKQFCTGS